MDKYTGREIAIFTDVHGLLYPVIAILEDIKKRGIKEIYSLGDAIGVGPNPSEVLDLLGEYNVKCINGNSEDYSVLGIEPFASYFRGPRVANQEWTMNELIKKGQLEMVKGNKHSYDLVVGGEKIALCHFANDVRIDFSKRSTWSYQHSINYGIGNPQEQFYYTNSEAQKAEIMSHLNTRSAADKGYESANRDPLFCGKTIDKYDEIIQGHVHFKLLTQDEVVKIRTIRAAGMAYQDDPIDFASYILIKEKDKGYDVIEILVPFDRALMLDSIDKSTIPYKDTINRFVSRK